MIRISTLLFLCLAFVVNINAQKSINGMPESMDLPELKSISSIPNIGIAMPQLEQIFQPEGPGPVIYGVYTDTTLDIRSAGRLDLIPGKGKIWRLGLNCPDALSMQVLFKNFQIPEHARLFLYDTEMNRIYGAFTKANNRPDLLFTIADFPGNQVIVEYFEPLNCEFEGKVIVGSIGLGFRDPLLSEAGPGFINVNCPIGKIAQLAKHAVCKMTFQSGDYQVTCSGALINNSRNDGTPYFLTANHCLSLQDEAATLITHFNYENAGCNGAIGESPTLSGATLLATGKASDFTLLVLDDVPPPSYQPYYGGWDARNESTDSVMGVHVPYLETKKISLDYDSIISNQVSVVWDDNSRSPIGSHWIIGFDDGGTSQGSSGSPLFNSANQIIGQLHGGDETMAYYGKLSYSFTYKAPGFHTMRHYLDPDSTGIEQIAGYAPSSNLPDAFFTTRFGQVCLNTPIAFSDYSVFGPYQREWVITPSTYNFTNETNASSPDPFIEFLDDTTYSVTLRLSVNNQVAANETFNIKAADEIDIKASADVAQICDCDFDSLRISVDGADDFKWKILPGDENKITLSDTTGEKVTIFRVPVFESDSTYKVGLLVTGKQATCTDTLLLTYTLLMQVNDDIQNAIELNYGVSETYSNICATVEEGEPVPPFTSCTTQDSWCDEYGTGEDIVENSVWFKFIAGSTGRVSITSAGMDNQIALYEADSYQAILDGDYSILGANDDRTDTDYRPIIRSESITPGQTYWIQVDGSGGGLEDSFTITINSLVATGLDENQSLKMDIYPQPAGDVFYIAHPSWTSNDQISIRVLNSAGILVNQSLTGVSNGTVSVQCNNWTPGLYLVIAESGKSRYIAQMVKR